MEKFKIGDMVYCQTMHNKISKITRTNEDNDVFLDKAGWFKNTGVNVNGIMVNLTIHLKIRLLPKNSLRNWI